MILPESICRLCGETASLCDSHVVPEYYYTLCYGADHRLIGVDERVAFPKTLQKGVRHKLFCKACEGFLNTNIEQPFKRIYDRDFWKLGEFVRRFQDCDVRQIKGIDYGVFKLFCISVLWRFSLVPSSSFYIAPQLGSHSDTMRSMIRNLDAGPERKYAVRLCHVTMLGERADIISGANFTRDGHFRYYRFILSGYRFEVQVGSEELMNSQANSLNLKEDGSILIFNHDLAETENFQGLHSHVCSLNTPRWAQQEAS